MILKNKQFEEYSKIVCDKVGIEEGEAIGVKLLQELSNSKTGIGLAAPQIGITNRVCVINVKEPIIFINPEIIESDGEFIFEEGCLSYPKKMVKVKRYTMVAVDADNLDEPLVFDIRKGGNIEDLLEIACVQHEIDHLDGITMFDRKFVTEPIRVEKKYGRNEKIVIISKDNKQSRKLKWKKAQPLINTGDWSILTYPGMGPIPQ
jgi:peptide deformylase